METVRAGQGSVEKSAFYLSFVIAILLPTFHVYFGALGAAFVNLSIISILAMTFTVTSLYAGRPLVKYFLAIFLYFLIYFIFILVSMLSGYIYGGVDIIGRDFFELYRPVLYFFTFFISYSFISSEDEFKPLEKFLNVIFIIVVLLGINHYFRIIDYISLLYTKSHNVTSGRVSAPFVNPYDYAFFMTFYVLLYFFKVISGRYVYLPLFVVSCFMIVLPQSRSVVGGFGLGVLLFLPISFFLLESVLKNFRVNGIVFNFLAISVLVLTGLILVLPIIIEKLPYLSGQFIKLLNGEGLGKSASLRFEQLLFAYDQSVNFMVVLFGNGPAKSELEFVESVYAYFYYRYGILGFSAFFIFPLSLGIYSSFILAKRSTQDLKPLFLALFSWFIMIPLLVIGNNFTEQVRLSFFYYAMLGLCVGAVFRMRVNIKV